MLVPTGYDPLLPDLQVEDVMSNMKHGAPYRSTLHPEHSPMLAHLEWYWKCALRGWAFR